MTRQMFHLWLIALSILALPQRRLGATQLSPPPIDLDSETDPCRRHAVCWSKEVQGYVFYENEDYAKALVEWEAAYRTVPVPRMLLNIGRAHFRLGHCAAAEAAYQGYLQAPLDQSQAYRPEATRWLSELRLTPQCASLPPPAAALSHAQRRPYWPWLIVLGAAAVTGLGLGLGLTPVPYRELQWLR